MKKRKILVLFPLLGLLLSGCTFQEGYTTTKNWISDHIIQPIKNLFNKNKDSGGGSDSGKDSGKDSGSDSGKTDVEINFGTESSPLSLSQFQVEIEKAIDYSTVEEGKTVTYQEAPFYVKGTVKTNEALGAHSEGQIRFTNLVDSSNSNVAVTGYYLSFDSSVESATYGAQNAMAGKEVIIKGYGMLYNKAGTKTYQIGNQKKDGEKGYILSVIVPPPTPGTNYGTLEEPLTASEAWALLDGESPSKATMYVGGEVKSNTAWSTQYNNVDIVITDGSKDFTIFRTATFPLGYDGTAITENSLVGKQVIASGTGKIYVKDNVSTYELDQGCVVEYIEGYEEKTIVEIVDVSVPESVVKGASLAPSQVTVTVKYNDNSTGSGIIKDISLDTSVAGEGVQGTINIEGYSQLIPFTINVVETSNSMAAPYAAALAAGSSETAEFTFDGVIVAKRGDNEWFIQNGEYGIEYYAANTDFAVGKHVQVVSTLQNYKGLPETKTIKSGTVLGDGELPNPVVIDSKAALDSANFNLLATVTGTAKEDWSSYSGSSNKTLTLETSDGDIPVYLKSGFFNTMESSIQAVKAGDTVTFGNVVTSIFTSRQMVACYGLTISVDAAPAKTISSATATGPSSAVAVGYTFQNSDVSVTVEYAEGGSGVGVVTSVTADTSVAGENLTGSVTIEGWAEPVEFTYSVSSSTPTSLKQTASYPACDTTTNMDGSNQATALGVTDTHLSLVGTKENGGTNNVGLNKAGQIRLYKGSTCALTISITGGTITSLDIKLGGTVDGLAVNGTTVSDKGTNKTVSVAINGTSAVITNDGTSGQTYILSIDINYTLNA